MLYLSGVRRPELPLLARPGNGHTPLPGQTWAADTGLFGKSGSAYSDDAYLAWLDKQPRETCLFATAPDVVGEAGPTLARSAPMYARIRALGFVPALVAQDGLERLTEFIPWDDFGCLFIGGSTEWKLGEAAVRLVAEAKRRGKWVHMGRVNSLRRMIYAESIGCDSADGTKLRFQPGFDVAHWSRHVVTNPSLWGGNG